MLLDTFKENGFLRLNGTMNASFIKKLKNRPDWLRDLDDYQGDTLSEKLFHLVGKPRTMCEVCQAPTEFKSYSEGYARFCSKSCKTKSMIAHRPLASGAADPETLAKMRATCKAKYGFENPFEQADLPKGTPNPEKLRATMLKKYGVDHVSKMPGMQERKARAFKASYAGKAKTIETNQKKYGVTWAQQSPDVINKIKESRYKNTFINIIHSERFLEKLTPLFTLADYCGHTVPMKYQCKLCNNIFEASFEDGKLPRCQQCYPSNNHTSFAEEELSRYIAQLLPNETIIRNDKSILSGKHLDIVIPGKKLAIEFNGNFWHAELSAKRAKGYHLAKTVGCEVAGIRLLHIFSDEWIEKTAIVKSVIAAALGHYETKLGARELNVVPVKSLVDFYEANHIQGNAKSSVNLALVLNGEVLAGLSCKKPRFSKEADWEITRFAVRCGYSIPGAFSRLLKTFRKNHTGSIVTYSERRLFTGSMYLKNGFTACQPSPPGYWYTKDYQRRENRMKYQKHRLANADPNLTEWENMQLKGYDRIWDCGQFKFVLN